MAAASAAAPSLAETNTHGERPEGVSHGPEDLAATMYRSWELTFWSSTPPKAAPVKIVNDGKIITDLI